MLFFASVKIYFSVHRVEIVWHFAFCENKSKKEHLISEDWSDAFVCRIPLFSPYLSDIGKLSSLCISEIKNSHFLGERYSQCRILDWLKTTSVSRRKTTHGTLAWRFPAFPYLLLCFHKKDVQYNKILR